MNTNATTRRDHAARRRVPTLEATPSRGGAESSPERADVVALILTFDSPGNALRCVRALGAQTVPVGEILVIQNLGEHLADQRELSAAFAGEIELVTLADNGGPAGGYAAGLDRLRSSACEFVWVMDDDVVPAADCLERLRARLRVEGQAVVWPASADFVSGEQSSTWGWTGVLFPRRLIEEVGVPNSDLFYGFEDVDYLIDRPQPAGYRMVREERALVHLIRRDGLTRPSWHYYYLSRNAVYEFVHGRCHIPFVQRMKRLAYFEMKLARHLLREPDRRGRRLLLYLRGVFDGVLGRLGRRVVPDSSARPELREDAGPG